MSSSGSVQEHMTAVVNKVMNDSVPKIVENSMVS